jgi:hypothetical protein
MDSTEYSVEQHVLSNKHLKERNDNLATEKESLYQLRCKHRVEHDQLTFERVTDSVQHLGLSVQQIQEIDQLKQQNDRVRLSLLERHLQEKNLLRYKA